jgi:hypothetical protein
MRVFAVMQRGEDWRWPAGSEPELVQSVRGCEWVATIYRARTRRAEAIVCGSWRYVKRGLRAAGLATPIRLPEHWDGRELTFVGRKPADRNVQSAG